jgi:hypothetical protein
MVGESSKREIAAADLSAETDELLKEVRAEAALCWRPETLPTTVVERIVAEHQAGVTWSEIGRRLEADGVPTAQGGDRWWPSIVRSVFAVARGRSAALAPVPTIAGPRSPR